jgi:hypothetical protein
MTVIRLLAAAVQSITLITLAWLCCGQVIYCFGSLVDVQLNCLLSAALRFCSHLYRCCSFFRYLARIQFQANQFMVCFAIFRLFWPGHCSWIEFAALVFGLIGFNVEC